MQLARFFVACLFCSQAVLSLNAAVELFWDPPASGTPLGYNVYRSVAPGGGFTLLNSQLVSTCSYTDNGAAPGNTYYYVVKSISQCGTESQSSNQLAVSVSMLNNNPTADAGPDSTVYSGQTVTLAGFASDPDGDPLYVGWSQISGPSVALFRASSSFAVFTAPSVPSETLLVFRLSVSDGKGGVASDDVRVIVRPISANRDPVVDAGPDQNAKAGRPVILEGSASDPDGDQLSYAWTQVTGPVVHLFDVEKPSASFIAPKVESKSVARFRFTVTDRRGGRGSDEVSVTLRPANQKPIATAGPGQTVLGGERVRLCGEGDDPDGDPLTYSWSQVSGPAVSMAKPEPAAVTFTAPQSWQTVKLSFEFLVTDSEGETATDRVDVTVLGDRGVGPLSGPAKIPAIEQVFSESYVAAAIVNRSHMSRGVPVSLLDDDGAERRKMQLSPLPPNGQRAFIPSFVCGLDSQTAALLFDEDDGSLRGMFALADYRMTRLDGISSNPTPAKRLYFPLMQKPSEKGLLSLFNSGDETAEVKLTLRDGRDGTVLSEVVKVLPRHGTLMTSPVDLFAVDPIVPQGYVQAESTQPLRGFQVLGSESAYSSLPALPAADTAELWLPHFVLGSPDLGTTLRLLNAGTSGPLSVQVEAYAEGGAPVVSRTLQLRPGQLVEENLRTFGRQLQDKSGHMKVTASQPDGSIPQLVGAVQFSGNNGAVATAVPLQPRGKNRTLFPQIAQSLSSAIFTGVAILNPSSKTSHVTVAAWFSDGTLHQEVSFALEPGKRVVDLLDGKTFFGARFEQINGYLVVSSDLPVVSMVLWGDYGMNYLAAAEGQEVEQAEITSP